MSGVIKDKPLRLVFTKDDTLTSRLVRLFTWGYWSHVSMIDPDDDSKVLSSSMNNGVKQTPLKPLLERSTDHVILTVPTLPAGLIKSMITPHIGKGYDFPGVLHFITPWHKEDPERFFCSEIIGMAIGSIVPDFFDGKRPSKLTPDDIFTNSVRSVMDDYMERK